MIRRDLAHPARTLLLVWLLLVAAALAWRLGSTPLYDADEGRNAEVGREMAATNDYVMPRIDGMPYLDKPIVYFAAEAAAMEVLGPTELAARLPAYLFTLATAAVLFWFARRVWDEETALLAAIAYLAMPLTMAFARTVIFDSALTFFVVVAIVAFYVSVERQASSPVGAIRQARTPVAPQVIAWAAIGFGVLTKGPVAILLPLVIAIPFAIKQKRFRTLWSWWGLVAFVAIIAPWVWAVSQVVPDFLHYVLVTETAQRLATKALKRTGPPWYFIPYLLGGALPWSIAAIAGAKELRKKLDPATLYAVLWVAVPFVFFSISQSKRPQYILPVMPAIALLAARLTRGFRAAAIAWIALGAVLLAAPHFAKHMRPELLQPAKVSALALGIIALLAGIAALIAKRRELAFVALSIPVIAIPIACDPLLEAIGERRSARSFVAQLAPRLGPSTQVEGIEAYTGSLQFYLRRPVTVVTPDAAELTSNYIIRHYAAFANQPQWPVRSARDRAHGDRVYVVRNDDRTNRVLLEREGHALIASGAHFVAYR
jgi:4-amino-4-deoxy-L-arabinose transferase-like glycosyltransferase